VTLYAEYKQKGATRHARGGLGAQHPGYPSSRAVVLVACRTPETMTWWTVQIAVVIVCVGGAKAGIQEAGPHSGPTAADKGYVAGELARSHTHYRDECADRVEKLTWHISVKSAWGKSEGLISHTNVALV
jgi:hypothetical protein